MSRINPIHIVLLLAVLLLFTIMKLNAAKGELADTQKSYAKTVTLAENIEGLKKSYFNPSKIQRSINVLLRSPMLRLANIHKKVTHSSILLSSDSMNKRSLNYLLGKILNGTYVVSLLEINRLDAQKASLKLEIKW